MKILIFNLFFILVSVSLSANMRAPLFLFSPASYAASSVSGELTVKKEDLSFDCPKHENPSSDKGGFTREALEADCSVSAVYETLAERDGTFRFEFILPSSNETTVTVNEEKSQKINPVIIKKLTDSEKEIYRVRHERCVACTDKNEISLYRVSFTGALKKGTNRISAEYRQILGYAETSHGYFSSSKWAAEFSYELWPLKEWKLASDFQMNVRFTVPAPGFFSSGVGTSCRGEDLNFQKYPFSILKKEYKTSETGTLHQPERTKPNPFSSLKEKRKISEKDGKILYEVSFGNSFPDRIICSYGHTSER